MRQIGLLTGSSRSGRFMLDSDTVFAVIRSIRYNLAGNITMCYQIGPVAVAKLRDCDGKPCVSNAGSTVGPRHWARTYSLATCWIVFAVVQGGLVAPASAADPSLDAAFQALVHLQQGQDLGIFGPIEQVILHAHSDARVRTDIERRLIGVLQQDATGLAKQYVCRQLALVGSDASIPILANMLSNAQLSSMARYALEGIDSAAAKASLRAAIKVTNGRQLVGVVISLGRLADADAVAAISALLAQQDPELREAALTALGRIGTVHAADTLAAFSANAPDVLQGVLVDAQCQAAEVLCKHHEFAAAAAIYKSLQSATSERIQAAAFRGLIAAQPGQALAMIITGLSAEESWKRAVAADCVLTLEKPDAIKSIAAAVSTLPIDGRIAALASLRNRRHPAVRDAALQALTPPDIEVCTVALQALITSGTAHDVVTLADLATDAAEQPVREAAFRTLCLMTADGTNQVLRALIMAGRDPSPVLLDCALERRAPEFVSAFLHAAESSSRDSRLAAFKALAIMATGDNVDALVGLLCKTPPGDEREAAGRAVWMACQKVPDPAKRTSPLLRAFQATDAAGQCAILPSLARMGGADSLVAVHKAMRSGDAAVRDAGYRSLANWPDATVADELLDIAKTDKVEAYRIWSLRAFARVVSVPGAVPPAKAFTMLKAVLPLAARAEDRQLVVERLGAVRVRESLSLLLSLLDDPELKQTATGAIFAAAKGLSQSDPELAAAALKKIRPLTKDPATIQQIPKVLRDIETRLQQQKK